MLTTHALQTLTQVVNRWTPGTFLEAHRHAHVGGGNAENAPLVSESMTQSTYMSEAATRTIEPEKFLGQGAFGEVIQVVCAMDGSRHAVKLANNVVSRTCVYTAVQGLSFVLSIPTVVQLSMVLVFMRACLKCRWVCLALQVR